jgi:hypothetical protein
VAVASDVELERLTRSFATEGLLSMRDARLQDRIDARSLLATGTVDRDEVRRLLSLIQDRGFARGQDLRNKLEGLLSEAPE